MVMKILMLLLRFLTWMRVYRSKAFLDHCPMIMIVSEHTLYIKSSMENPDLNEWVPTSLCENPRLSLPKESVLYLRYLVVILEVIAVFDGLPRPCSLVFQVFFLGVSPV